ncbi:MAG: multiubiquitin domain-containing protein [Bacteroidetes bacterium]|nr:multiubiquitin domain-containing protein [Bacteroidota bacterium]
MQTLIQIDGKDHSLPSGLIEITDLYELADCGNMQLFLVRYNDLEIPLMIGEYLCVHGGEVLKTKKDINEEVSSQCNEVRPVFNSARNIVIDSVKITGKELKKFDSTFPEGRLFIESHGEVDVEISDDMTIIIQEQDSYFVIPPSLEDVIDHEECGKHNRKPPRGYSYCIRIDTTQHVVDSDTLSGAEILALAEKRTDEWSLNKKWHGGKRERVATDDQINLSHCGIERFETVPKQAQYGRPYTFGFLPEDIQYLDQHYPSRWSKKMEGNAKYGLIIKEFPLPKGYIYRKSTLMILVPIGYPGSALDMFYFWHPLEKMDGSPISSLSSETHFGKEWQRWSRHYDWKSGHDSIARHIEFVVNMLHREVLK